MLKYIELKTGFNDNGPAWIAKVKVSKSGRHGVLQWPRAETGLRWRWQFSDIETGESFWISGVKRDGTDRHRGGSGRILIEAAAVDEYLSLIGRPELDSSRLTVTHDIRETDASDFVELENKPL